MRGTQVRRLRQEAITRYEDGERPTDIRRANGETVQDDFKTLYRHIKRRWTRQKRVG